MKHSIEIENLKCGGCENTIRSGLAAIDGVADISVDHEQSTVSFSAPESQLPLVREKLVAMGYPERGTVSGLNAGLATAKSFVSCAIGRVKS
jgi:copper chaperone